MSASDVDIRPLELDDVPEIVPLWEACGLPARPEGRDSSEQLRAQVMEAGDLFLAARVNGRLVGTALGSIDGRRKGWLNRIAVHPDVRRQGVGRMLVAALERALERRGSLVHAALIEPENAASIAMFEDVGYDVTDIVYVRKPTSEGA